MSAEPRDAATVHPLPIPSKWEQIFTEKIKHADDCPFEHGDADGDGHVECECYVAELWDALVETIERPLALTSDVYDRLLSRADLLDKVERSGKLPDIHGTEAPLLREAAGEIDRLARLLEEKDRYETCREAYERYST